jgi:head-tail adaptor
MSFVPPIADLDWMVRDATAAMIETCAIQSPTLVDDGGGGGTMAWTTVATVPSSIMPFRQRDAEIVVSDVQQTSILWMATLPLGTTISLDQRLIIGAHTLAILTPIMASYATSLRLVCKEVI